MDTLVYYSKVKFKQISQCKHLKVVWVIAGVPGENENKAIDYTVHTICKRSTFRNVEFNVKWYVKIFTLL